MADRSQDPNRVRVKITPEEIEIINNDKLAWSKTYTWPEVTEINIETSYDNLFTDTESANRLPLSVKSGEILLGERSEVQDSSIEDFAGEANESGSDMDREDETSRPPEPIERGEFWTNVKEETGIEYDPNSGEVEFPEQYSGSEGFRKFVQYLFDNRYLNHDDLPWSTPNSTKNYVINDEPMNKKGEELPAATEAVPGVYFDGKMPREYKERYARMLAEEFAGI